MKFNYSKLLGRIKEYGFTQARLAEAIGVNQATLNGKLNGHFSFTPKEILAISKELDIPKSEISIYFFAE